MQNRYKSVKECWEGQRVYVGKVLRVRNLSLKRGRKTETTDLNCHCVSFLALLIGPWEHSSIGL